MGLINMLDWPYLNPGSRGAEFLSPQGGGVWVALQLRAVEDRSQLPELVLTL